MADFSLATKARLAVFTRKANLSPALVRHLHSLVSDAIHEAMTGELPVRFLGQREERPSWYGSDPGTVALVSYPRSGNSLLRSLVEKVTGVYTGSDSKILGLSIALGKMGLLGEGRVDSTVLAVKSHYPERPGRVRFVAKKIVLLVRHPLDAIDSHFNMILTDSHTTSVSEERYKTLFALWYGFVCTEALIWQAFHRFWRAQHAAGTSVFIVRYEDLVRDRAQTLTQLFAFLSSSSSSPPPPSCLPSTQPELDADLTARIAMTIRLSSQRAGAYRPRTPQPDPGLTTPSNASNSVTAPLAGKPLTEKTDTPNSTTSDAQTMSTVVSELVAKSPSLEGGRTSDQTPETAKHRTLGSALKSLRHYTPYLLRRVLALAGEEMRVFGYHILQPGKPASVSVSPSWVTPISSEEVCPPHSQGPTRVILLNQEDTTLRRVTAVDTGGRGYTWLHSNFSAIEMGIMATTELVRRVLEYLPFACLRTSCEFVCKNWRKTVHTRQYRMLHYNTLRSPRTAYLFPLCPLGRPRVLPAAIARYYSSTMAWNTSPALPASAPSLSSPVSPSSSSSQPPSLNIPSMPLLGAGGKPMILQTNTNPARFHGLVLAARLVQSWCVVVTALPTVTKNGLKWTSQMALTVYDISSKQSIASREVGPVGGQCSLLALDCAVRSDRIQEKTESGSRIRLGVVLDVFLSMAMQPARKGQVDSAVVYEVYDWRLQDFTEDMAVYDKVPQQDASDINKHKTKKNNNTDNSDDDDSDTETPEQYKERLCLYRAFDCPAAKLSKVSTYRYLPGWLPLKICIEEAGFGILVICWVKTRQPLRIVFYRNRLPLRLDDAQRPLEIDLPAPTTLTEPPTTEMCNMETGRTRASESTETKSIAMNSGINATHAASMTPPHSAAVATTTTTATPASPTPPATSAGRPACRKRSSKSRRSKKGRRKSTKTATKEATKAIITPNPPSGAKFELGRAGQEAVLTVSCQRLVSLRISRRPDPSTVGNEEAGGGQKDNQKEVNDQGARRVLIQEWYILDVLLADEILEPSDTPPTADDTTISHLSLYSLPLYFRATTTEKSVLVERSCATRIFLPTRVERTAVSGAIAPSGTHAFVSLAAPCDVQGLLRLRSEPEIKSTNQKLTTPPQRAGTETTESRAGKETRTTVVGRSEARWLRWWKGRSTLKSTGLRGRMGALLFVGQPETEKGTRAVADVAVGAGDDERVSGDGVNVESGVDTFEVFQITEDTVRAHRFPLLLPPKISRKTPMLHASVYPMQYNGLCGVAFAIGDGSRTAGHAIAVFSSFQRVSK